MRTRRPRPAPATRSAFAGFRFPSDVIVLAVRWYLRFGLSYRDVEELLAERGIEVDHVTIYRWVLRFTPLLADAARPCRHAVGDRWQVDETARPAGAAPSNTCSGCSACRSGGHTGWSGSTAPPNATSRPSRTGTGRCVSSSARSAAPIPAGATAAPTSSS
jgi:hypothetical protein